MGSYTLSGCITSEETSGLSVSDVAIIVPAANTLTVTRETTDLWNEQCDEGKLNFCDYSIMGLTQSGAKDLLLDLEKIDYYQLRLNFGEEARIEALKALRDLQLKRQPK